MPAAARAGREDEKRATVAVNEVAIGIPFLANRFTYKKYRLTYKIYRLDYNFL